MRKVIGHTRRGPVYEIAGAETPPPSGGGQPTQTQPPPATPPPAPPERTFTQEDVNRIMAREKDEGRRAGEKALLEKLGAQNADEAEATLKAAREAAEAQKTEAQKAAEEAARQTAAAVAATAQANAATHQIRVERALLLAGLPVERVSRVARLMDVASDATDDALKASVEDLKKEMPEVFGGKPTGGAPSGDPPGGAPSPKPREDDKFTEGYKRGMEKGKPRSYATQTQQQQTQGA